MLIIALINLDYLWDLVNFCLFNTMTEFTQSNSHFDWQCGKENNLNTLCKQF